MKRLNEIKEKVEGPYGMQALNTHDIAWMIEKLEKAEAAAKFVTFDYMLNKSNPMELIVGINNLSHVFKEE